MKELPFVQPVIGSGVHEGLDGRIICMSVIRCP